MSARKRKPIPKQRSKSKSRPKPKLNILAITCSGAFRIVQEKGGHVLEIYQNKDEAISAGVAADTAERVFSDIRPAFCYAEVQNKQLIRCRKRSLGTETCEGECHLFADGTDLGTGAHLFEPDVTYRCRCIP